MNTMDNSRLLRAFDVAYRVRRSTQTIIRWARRGWIPGAVFVGPHVMFDPQKVEAFIQAGGTKPEPAEVEPSPALRVTLRRVGYAREHASRHDNGMKPDGACKHSGRAPIGDVEVMSQHRIIELPGVDSRTWNPDSPQLKA